MKSYWVGWIPPLSCSQSSRRGPVKTGELAQGVITSVLSTDRGMAGSRGGVGVLGSRKFKTGLSGNDNTRYNGELTLPSSTSASAHSFPSMFV